MLSNTSFPLEADASRARFLARVPAINDKVCYVEHESAKDELAAARDNFRYLRELDF